MITKYVKIMGGCSSIGMWYENRVGEYFKVSTNIRNDDIQGSGNDYYLTAERPYRKISLCHCLTQPGYEPPVLKPIKKIRGVRQIRRL
jgi:hypothetical protein